MVYFLAPMKKNSMRFSPPAWSCYGSEINTCCWVFLARYPEKEQSLDLHLRLNREEEDDKTEKQENIVMDEGGSETRDVMVQHLKLKYCGFIEYE